MRRPFAFLLYPLLTLALLAPGALADGDPASDVLAGPDRVFTPYAPTMDDQTQSSIRAQTTAASRAGLPLRVAVIARASDLGAYPQLLGKPQQYATLLAGELRYFTSDSLLVVMPTGYGLVSGNAKARTALAGLPPAGSADPAALGAAAIAAVRRLSAAAGHPLAAPPRPKPPPHASSNPPLLAIGLGAGAVLVLALAVWGWSRPRKRP